MTTGETLSTRQMRAIAAILATDSREQAANQAGVSDRTLRRWQNLDHFAAELRRQRTRALDAVTTVLVGGSASCARVLVAIANGEIRATPTRVSAARAVLDTAQRFEEQGTLIQRLEALEAAAATTNPERPKGHWNQ